MNWYDKLNRKQQNVLLIVAIAIFFILAFYALGVEPKEFWKDDLDTQQLNEMRNYHASQGENIILFE